MEVVAVDIGGTKTAMCVVHETGDILLETRKTVTPTPKNPQDALKVLTDYIVGSWRQYDIRAVGIGAPGLVGGQNGGYFLPKVSNLPEWSNLHLRNSLEAMLADATGEKIPLSIESDVYPATVAELLARIDLLRNRISDELFPFFYLTISTGVGGEQAIRNGTGWKIYRNETGALEVGHAQFHGIAPNMAPIVCGCRKTDCAETWLGGNHMKRRYGLEPEDATPEMISGVAQNLAGFLYQNQFTRDSTVIVVGGKIANEWGRPPHHFIDEARHSMGILFSQSGHPVPSLEASRLGDDVGIVGGWAIAMKQLTGKWPEYRRLLASNGGYAGTFQPSPAVL